MSADEQQVSQALPTRIPKRWPLVNRFQARSPAVPLNKDARLLNCYAEFDPEDKEYWVYKRLGISPAPAFGIDTGFGKQGCGIYAHPVSSLILSVVKQTSNNVGNLFYGNGGAGSVASMHFPDTLLATPVWFETVNSNPQTVMVSTGIEAWSFNVATFVATKVSNANYPPQTVPGWAYLDGTLYTMDPQGTIWGSALNDGTTWSGTNNIAASSNADAGVALIKQLNYIIALKQYTAQAFFDNGPVIAGGTPLAPVPDSQMPLGCYCANSVQQIDNTILWVTSNQTDSPQIVQLDNLIPRIVSTPAIERILDNIMFSGGFVATTYTPQANVWSWTLKHGGHRFYVLTFVLSNITLIYDLDQQLWYFWYDPNGNYWPWVASASIPPNVQGNLGVHYVQHINNGGVYQIDGAYSYPNDAGVVFPVDIYTPNMDFGTNRRKHLKMMFFNADRVPGTLISRFSDDDYNTWSNPRSVDLNLKKPRLSNNGTFKRRRAYHFQYKGNTDFRIKTVDLQMDLGTL